MVVFYFSSERTNTTGSHTVTPPAGWTAEYSTIYSGNTRIRGTAIWRILDGSEGASIDVTTSDACHSTAIGLLISGVANEGAAIDSVVDDAQSSNINPQSLSPSWGESANLWIVALHGENPAGKSTPAAPSLYGNTQVAGLSGEGDETYTATAERTNTNGSEDPGAWTADNDRYIFSTIAIRPAGGSAPDVIGRNVKTQTGGSTSHTLTIPTPG